MGIAGQSILVFDEVALSYRSGNGSEVPVLKGVSFDVREGEFVCLMGPSGCGKTTLINLAAGFLACNSGILTMCGNPICGPSSERTVVFQEYALFPWKTALENVAFGLKAKGFRRTECEEKARKWLRLVGLGASEGKLPGELSGGMQQRVALARALAAQPEVLLMDEPLGALDAQTRELLQEDLAAILEAQRKAILMVTHSVEEALYMGDRIVMLGSHPATVMQIRSVPLPRPRHSAVRETSEFLSLKAEVSTQLRGLCDSIH